MRWVGFLPKSHWYIYCDFWEEVNPGARNMKELKDRNYIGIWKNYLLFRSFVVFSSRIRKSLESLRVMVDHMHHHHHGGGSGVSKLVAQERTRSELCRSGFLKTVALCQYLCRSNLLSFWNFLRSAWVSEPVYICPGNLANGSLYLSYGS